MTVGLLRDPRMIHLHRCYVNVYLEFQFEAGAWLLPGFCAWEGKFIAVSAARIWFASLSILLQEFTRSALESRRARSSSFKVVRKTWGSPAL
jgi:hypothetical protein